MKVYVVYEEDRGNGVTILGVYASMAESQKFCEENSYTYWQSSELIQEKA
jgi:hypothetical protein